MPSKISLDYISHSFTSEARILSDIDVNISARELCAIIGKSGCGKSTLLHIIAGLLQPTEGCCRIDGTQVTRPSAKWNMMFQQASLYPWMTVENNAALGLKFAGMHRAARRARVRDLLHLVGLGDKAEVNVQQLSGGQQQRVALARSLATEPHILLLDEPFSALDAFTRAALQEEVPQICRDKGITMVLVTHDIDEAIKMSDRVLVMDSSPGRVLASHDIKLPWPRQSNTQGFISAKDSVMSSFSSTTKPQDKAQDKAQEVPFPALINS